MEWMVKEIEALIRELLFLEMLHAKMEYGAN